MLDAKAAAHALTLQFLTWVEERPRTYGEAMDRWRTSCPRLSIWEDAFVERLVQLENRAGTPRDACPLTLTRRGRSLLGRR